jgi:hypothetical protein
MSQTRRIGRKAAEIDRFGSERQGDSKIVQGN